MEWLLWFELSYLLRMLARAASFAILIGSGIEPWSVKQLTIVDASFELNPQYRTNTSLPVSSGILSLFPSLRYCSNLRLESLEK